MEDWNMWAMDGSRWSCEAYICILYICMYIWGFIKNPVLSITSSGEIGFWEHDIEASKMQGRARGRKGERKTYHIYPYHHITMEFGWYLLNVAKTPTRARARKGEAQGVLSYQKATGIFDNPHIYIYYIIYILFLFTHIYIYIRWTFIGPIWTPPLAFIVCLRAWFVCLCTV